MSTREDIGAQAAPPNPWGDDALAVVVAQVVELITSATRLRLDVSADARSFSSRAPSPSAPEPTTPAALSAYGRIVEGPALRVEIELIRAPTSAFIAVSDVFRRVPQLFGRWQPCEPRVAPAPGTTALWAGINLTAEPLTTARRVAFRDSLATLLDAAQALRKELPDSEVNADADKAYARLSEHLTRVHPLDDASPAEPRAWADETIDFLAAGYSVALAAPNDAESAFALGALAGALGRRNRTLGRVGTPGLNPRAVLELSSKAPGTLVVAASRLTFGSQRYEIGDDVQGMLRGLGESRTAAIFTGTFAELQQVFHGGQGGRSDPLWPVVRHAPAIGLAELARQAGRGAARAQGGLTRSREEAICAKVLAALEGVPDDEARGLIQGVATLAAADGGGRTAIESLSAFVQTARAANEVLGGLARVQLVSRPPRVEARFAEILAGEQLEAQLRDNLFGQDRALAEWALRLCTEVLTRPGFQPLRVCAQGTPGTGKSASSRLLADALDVPHVNIDCASFPDWYTASAQLLGSGRGIVGSHQPGRLEQAARSERGAVIEISDLDHASAHLRPQLADFFLKVLETGEADSAATGAPFSCASLIFCFTLNLPGGLDERLRRGRLGFGAGPSRDEIGREVRGELKRLLSGAFLSRVGDPILFDPLSPEDTARVAARAVHAALARALDVLGLAGVPITLASDVGAHVVAALGTDAWTSGARSLLDDARELATTALRPWLQRRERLAAGNLYVQPGAPGALTIDMKGQPS